MLTLKLTAATSVPLDLGGIVPERLRGLSSAEVERLHVWHGNRQLPLGEFFQISGDSADERLELEGQLAGVHRIGQAMTSGSIYATGDVGRHLGERMSGGSIVVHGSAGDWAAAAMQGGMIEIRKHAGDQLATALPGAARGMTGGTITVGGNAGRQVGRRMRRGLIAIAGDVGPCAALDMLAGTLLVFGRCAAGVGAGMSRGTIALFAGDPPALLPTFRPACRMHFAFVGLLISKLRRLGFNANYPPDNCEFQLYSGDLLKSGRGEILLPVA